MTSNDVILPVTALPLLLKRILGTASSRDTRNLASMLTGMCGVHHAWRSITAKLLHQSLEASMPVDCHLTKLLLNDFV